MYYSESKKKPALTEILDVLIKPLTIATAIAPVIGCFIIYKYLSMIDQLSLLPDILSSTTNFLVVGYIGFLIFIIITLTLLIPVIFLISSLSSDYFITEAAQANTSTRFSGSPIANRLPEKLAKPARIG